MRAGGTAGGKIECLNATEVSTHIKMPVLPADFDASLLTFSEPKALQSGAKSVNVQYNGASLQMQFSNLDVPYGLNVEDKYGPAKYSINVSLRDYDTNPKVKSVFNALESLDARAMKEAIDKNWLRKPGLTPDLMKQMDLFKSTVKFSVDRETGQRKPYPPTVKLALRKKKDGAFETIFYDSDKKEIKDVPIEDLVVKRMQVTVLAECTGAWISSVGCGLSWKIKQLKVVNRPETVGRGYGFVDEDEDETPAPSRRPAAAPVKSSGFANAFDDDGEDEEKGQLEDDEEALAPPPAAKPAPAPVVVAPPSAPAEDVEAPAAPKRMIVKKKVPAKA